MSNDPKEFSQLIDASAEATDWCELQKGDSCGISIPAGITGVVNVERSFNGSTARGVLTADDGSTNFSGGAELEYTAPCREWIRVIGTTVTSGSATPVIRRN